MSNTDKKGLSGVDICRIIKQCQASGVTHIKLGDLSIDFSPRRNEEVRLPGKVEGTLEVEALSSEHKEDAMLVEERTLDEAVEAQLMIDDPHGFEKLQIQRDVERMRNLA